MDERQWRAQLAARQRALAADLCGAFCLKPSS
jgi:hypothetical protein